MAQNRPTTKFLSAFNSSETYIVLASMALWLRVLAATAL